MLKKGKALLFDLDGVLVDAVALHYRCFNDALFNIAGVRLAQAEHAKEFDGLPTKKKLQKLVDCHRVWPEQVDAIYQEKQRLTKNLAQEMIRPDPQKSEMLWQLNRDGYALACVSNCVRVSVDRLLELAQLRDYFAVTVSNEDVRHPKPAPDPYRHALSLLGITAEEAVAFEDNPRGLQSAWGAGVVVFQVEYAQVTYPHITELLDEQVFKPV